MSKYTKARKISGVVNHGALSGLGDDDHPQYFNDVRLAGTDIDRGEFYDTSLQNIPDLASNGPAYNFLDNSSDNVATGQDLITGYGGFSIVVLAKSDGLADIASVNSILAAHGNGEYGGFYALDPIENRMQFRIYDGSVKRTVFVDFDSTMDQDWHTWVGTVDTTGNGGDGYLYLYKDGKLVGTYTANVVAALSANGTTFNIGGDGGGRSWSGEIARVLVFNIGLTEPWVKTFSSGILVPFKWNKNVTDKPGDVRNSGNFVVGAAYRILTRTDGNFTDAGAANNNVGTEFIAIATASGVLDAGDTATRLGTVGIWEQDGMGHGQWQDKSGNEYVGTVLGAIAHNLPVNHQEKYLDLTVTGNTSFTLPKGYQIKSIVVKETAGNALTGGLDIGFSTNGVEVVSGMAVAGNTTVLCTLIEAGTIGSTFTTADDIIYLSDGDDDGNWNSASLELRVTMQRLMAT